MPFIGSKFVPSNIPTYIPPRVVTVPRVQTLIDQPVGPPIVTRHSVVTTSQPMLSSPVPQQVNQQVQQNLSGFI